jgi:hypothetical protein
MARSDGNVSKRGCSAVIAVVRSGPAIPLPIPLRAESLETSIISTPRPPRGGATPQKKPKMVAVPILCNQP